MVGNNNNDNENEPKKNHKQFSCWILSSVIIGLLPLVFDCFIKVYNNENVCLPTISPGLLVFTLVLCGTTLVDIINFGGKRKEVRSELMFYEAIIFIIVVLAAFFYGLVGGTNALNSNKNTLFINDLSLLLTFFASAICGKIEWEKDKGVSIEHD